MSPEIIFLNSISNLSDFPVVPSGSDANRDNATTLQQVNRADGSQRVIMPQKLPRMLCILGLHCGCYMVLILYLSHVFIPNSLFFQVPKPWGLTATTGQHRNRDKSIYHLLVGGVNCADRRRKRVVLRISPIPFLSPPESVTS